MGVQGRQFNRFSRFPPYQRGLPAGHPIAPIREIAIRPVESALGAPVNAGYAEFFELPACELRKIGHEPAPRVQLKSGFGPGVLVEKCLANLCADLEVLRSYGGSEPRQEAIWGCSQSRNGGADHAGGKASPSGMCRRDGIA